MKYLYFVFVFFLSLNAQVLKNDLQFETSPYLKQHETNPIQWMPWGEEAFERAKKENKAVFLSIGYSTCHWCHVMAKEAFENEKVAREFNKYFIAVKVDREELPHLDSYYQQLHIKVKKRTGGWPLSAFLTDDKKPFYVATYIPLKEESYHEGLDTLLPRIYQEYDQNQTWVLQESKRMESLMNKPLEIVKNDNAKISVTTLTKSINDGYDDIYSGFGRHKKFPEASKIALMMDLALIQKDKELEKKALQMLDTMALRGLYDHVGGGFYRYVVDAAWEIPHFEKMLYNQAELIPLYTRAYLLTAKKLYKDIVVETIAMVDKRFEKNNLFYSASDADTDHEEGAFFLFTTLEVENALKNNPNAKEIEESLEFTLAGNFEGKVHMNFYTKDRPKGFDAFKKELLKIRATKKYPFIDKKINTAWNALMIEALYSASVIDKKYAQKADEHLSALKEFMFKRGDLYHQSLLDISPKQLGLLEDYSFLTSALIAGYQVDYDKNKLAFAEYLLNKAVSIFYRDGIWYLSDDELHIKADLKDKYYTSALGKMLQNLIKLASLKASFRYEKLAISSLESINKSIEKSQSYVPASAIAFMMQKTSVVTLKNTKESLKKDALNIRKIKHPFVLTKSTKVSEYLACSMRSCFAKESEFKTIKKSIEKYLQE